MKDKQKRTYLVYSRGLMPADLTLGSLYLDPANPLDGEHKRFACSISTAELNDWTGEPEVDRPCSLTITAGREWLASAGVLGLLGGGLGKKRVEELQITGEKGRRFQIKRPETFINEVLLPSQAAKSWLGKQLSISRRMYHLSKVRLGNARYPRIWMVTGIQYIANARITNVASEVSSTNVSITVPLPDPVAATAIISAITGQDGLEFSLSTNHKDGTEVLYNHADERVWAAQFTALDVRFYTSLDEAEEGLSSAFIPLRELEDLGAAGVRQGETLDQFQVPERLAEVRGLEDEDMEQVEDNGDALLEAMLDVNWDLLDSFLETESWDSDEDEVVTEP